MISVLAVEQGTHATKALLVDSTGRVVSRAATPVGRSTPRPGWVEQDAEEIWDSIRSAVATCLAAASVGASPEVVAVGMTTQRESLLLWDRDSGLARSPVVTSRDRRGAAICDALLGAGHEPMVRALTGLPLDPRYPATKATWLLDEIDPDRRQCRQGRICSGTIDSWLLHRMTGQHVIEAGNASRTQWLDLRTGTWSEPLLDLFGVPSQVLAWVLPSTGPFRPIRGLPPLRDGTPLAAVLADEHAALFAHAGAYPGGVPGWAGAPADPAGLVAKASYGPGSSVMALAGPERPNGTEQVCLTIAWDRGSPAYALEGDIRSSGDTLVWLGNLLGISPEQVARLGERSHSDGVHLVPAFGGLAAPWWDRTAAGLVSGLTAVAGPGQLARAALESIAFQIEDVVGAIEVTTGRPVRLLVAVAGGAAGGAAYGGDAASPFLLQLQADLSGRRVRHSRVGDLSALGVAHLAGSAVGLWADDQLAALDRPGEDFLPASTAEQRRVRHAGWHAAVARAR